MLESPLLFIGQIWILFHVLEKWRAYIPPLLYHYFPSEGQGLIVTSTSTSVVSGFARKKMDSTPFGNQDPDSIISNYFSFSFVGLMRQDLKWDSDIVLWYKLVPHEESFVYQTKSDCFSCFEKLLKSFYHRHRNAFQIIHLKTEITYK